MSEKVTIVATGASLGILIVGLGAILVSDHGKIRADIREIRGDIQRVQTALTEIGQRVAHIEGRLEIPLDSEPTEDGVQE